MWMSGTDRGSRSRQPIELGRHQRVAGADGREGLVEAGPGTVGLRQPVIGVDPIGHDPELLDGDLLGREALFGGGSAGIAEQGGGRADDGTFDLP